MDEGQGKAPKVSNFNSLSRDSWLNWLNCFDMRSWAQIFKLLRATSDKTKDCSFCRTVPFICIVWKGGSPTSNDFWFFPQHVCSPFTKPTPFFMHWTCLIWAHHQSHHLPRPGGPRVRSRCSSGGLNLSTVGEDLRAMCGPGCGCGIPIW